jgi:NADPH-dependent curcumin reductase CurA
MVPPADTRRILLAAIPSGMPAESDFRLETVPAPSCPAGGLLVRTTWISVDPYLRGRMTGHRTYIDPIPVGGVMESGAVGEVIASQHPDFHPGDTITGFWGWQEFVALPAAGIQKVDPAEAPVSTALGILGMPGMTAYFGLTEICAPKRGETVLVTGAAGAVGSAAGQIARILGCRVVGTAGTPEKVAYIRSLGFDAALNYRTDKPYAENLARLCPNGIDCFFDNTGGELSDAALRLMNTFGRVSVCGQISQYNNIAQDVGPRLFWIMIVKQLRVEGFIVTRWAARFPEGRSQMAAWLRQGLLRYDESIYDGLEKAPRAFIGLFTGENTGKALVRL